MSVSFTQGQQPACLLSYCSQSKLAMMAGEVMRRAVLNVCSRRIAWTTSSIGGRISWTSSSVGARIWPTHTETAPSSSHHFLPWTVSLSPVRTLHLCANLSAGHNKWSKVKNIKGPKDAARARIWLKFGMMIRIAVKEGGSNPDLNVALAHAIEQCRNKNMPRASIELAIKSAEKTKSGTQHSYEARGPGGCEMLIDILTENINRSLAELKTALHRNGGALADGARHNFNRKGVIVALTGDITSDRALELAIEAGAEDVQEMEDEDDKPVLQFICDMKELKTVRTSLEELGIQIISAGMEFVAHKHVSLAQHHLEGASVLIEALNNCPDVVRVWDNIQAQS